TTLVHQRRGTKDAGGRTLEGVFRSLGIGGQEDDGLGQGSVLAGALLEHLDGVGNGGGHADLLVRVYSVYCQPSTPSTLGADPPRLAASMPTRTVWPWGWPSVRIGGC